MITKKMVVQNGEYVCDIDISVEEWKQILQDEKVMNDNYFDVLLKFYFEPEHKSTCRALSEKYNKPSSFFNGSITKFSEAVQKRLNRFEIIRENGEPVFWIIPMVGKYVGKYFEWELRPELAQAIQEAEIIQKSSILILSPKDLIGKINGDLGDFTDTFRYKRKEFKKHSRTSSKGILFKCEHENRDWFINEGGGTEVQYHLIYRDNKIRFGIGFNTQYVPHKNEMSPVEYMQPFANAYLSLLNSKLIEKLKEKGFSYYDFLENDLESLQRDRYYLFGREINVIDSHILIEEYNNMLLDI